MNNKIMWLALVVASTMFSFSAYAEEGVGDFEKAMGKDTPAWGYVETREDIHNLDFYKNLYEKNLTLTANSSEKIPKIFHFIWLGPKEFPKESLSNIASWLQKHPTWKAKFWTDIDRDISIDGLEKIVMSQYPFSELAELYYDAENYGEKSELLRYEILHQEGGVYVDHDMVCLRSLEDFCQRFGFFCGLEPLSTSLLSSSIYPGTHLIAAKPHHPIFLQSMLWLKQNWNFLGQAYPGTQEDHVINRVKHRSFSALEAGMKSGLNANTDIIFPSNYFSLKEPAKALYATHAHGGTWHKIENFVEKKLEAEWKEIRSKNKISQVLAYTATIVQLAIMFFLVILLKKSNKRRKKA